MSVRATLARRWVAGLGVLPALFALHATAAPVDAARIAAEGNGAGAAPCQSCHGTDGAGQATAGFPRLAGLAEHYLARQLDAFADGSRANPVMQPVARALSSEERQALAVFYSRLPVPKVSAQPQATGPQDGLGQQLATRGRWDQGVPPASAATARTVSASAATFRRWPDSRPPTWPANSGPGATARAETIRCS